MSTEHTHLEALTSDARTLARNLIGAFMILILSLVIVMTILAPEMVRVLNIAAVSHGAFEWLSVVGSVLITGFLIVFPVVLIVQGYIDYRHAYDLECIGILTKGSIAEKWVDDSDGDPIYHILYKYCQELKAIQVVDAEIFRSLQRDQIINVLHLKHAPHISRLELSL